ncbi:MAG: dprA [Homoserinimonas sp.]|nr:dprA [Homoserinimonas sp.]
MTMFGLKEAVVAPLVRSLTGRELSTKEVEERFARASWAGIVEPGDRVAGVLVATVGAADALTVVVEGWPATRIAQWIRAHGEDAVTVDDVVSALERWRPRLKPATALAALSQGVRFAVRLVTPDDTAWPQGLNDLGAHAPMVLWVRGNESTLSALDHSIALVGARAATLYGEGVTMEASSGLSDRGYAIVSGAAYGVDGMAHRAALASSGQTVAFLAGGVDRFYPSGHDALLTRIVESGAVISELPCGSQPTKWRFLQRNRLIAAASRATVVIEAGWRSGSLNTAGHAAALGRPLGAVPGPVTSAASAGCHRLIRDFDATCVTNAAEMAELAPIADGTGSGMDGIDPQDLPSDHLRVGDALSIRSPRNVPDIAARSGLSLANVQSVLGTMELEGRAVEAERGWVKRR